MQYYCTRKQNFLLELIKVILEIVLLSNFFFLNIHDMNIIKMQ